MENFISDRHQPVELYQYLARNTPVFLSLTFVSADRLIQWRDAPSSEWVRPLKIITAEVAFIGIVLLGLIESVVRGVLALLIRPIHLFAPDESFICYGYGLFMGGFAATTFATAIAVAELGVNLLSSEREIAVNKSINDVWSDLHDLLYPVTHFRFFSEGNTTTAPTSEEMVDQLEEFIQKQNPDFDMDEFLKELRERKN